MNQTTERRPGPRVFAQHLRALEDARAQRGRAQTSLAAAQHALSAFRTLGRDLPPDARRAQRAVLLEDLARAEERLRLATEYVQQTAEATQSVRTQMRGRLPYVEWPTAELLREEQQLVMRLASVREALVTRRNLATNPWRALAALTEVG